MVVEFEFYIKIALNIYNIYTKVKNKMYALFSLLFYISTRLRTKLLLYLSFLAGMGVSLGTFWDFIWDGLLQAGR